MPSDETRLWTLTPGRPLQEPRLSAAHDPSRPNPTRLRRLVGVDQLVAGQDFPFQAGGERLRRGIVETLSGEIGAGAARWHAHHLAGTALGAEPVERGTMSRSPRDPIEDVLGGMLPLP